MKYFIYCRKSQEAEDRQIMSLESQTDEVQRIIGSDASIEIVGTYTEAYSAKQPGRPLFNEMVKRIEKGHAQGIISWHPDRLARNSMDGGQIIYLLDQDKLTDLKFANYSFENSSQGKFMLSIMFGQSKYYVDNLSENVKRGQRTKIKNGWRPGGFAIGYRTCGNTGNILPDKPHFKIIRQIFVWFISGDTSIAEIHHRLRDEHKYRTPVRKSLGGRAISRSQIYRVLTNPFYSGYIVWNGKLHPGAHRPVVSKTEFRRAQEMLGLATPTRAKRHEHTYAGVFSCGVCGKSVTAERKRKKSGLTYTYYHCTRVHTTPRCIQPSVEEKALTKEIETFLRSIRIPKPMLKIIPDIIKREKSEEDSTETLNRHQADLKSIETQLYNLTDMRLRDMLDDAEFKKRQRNLTIAKEAALQNCENLANHKNMFEPVELFILLCNRAVDLFRASDAQGKRRLLKILCSNRLLIDKKPIFKTVLPFHDGLGLGLLSSQRADCINVGTQKYIAEIDYKTLEGWSNDHRYDVSEIKYLLSQYDLAPLKQQEVQNLTEK